jgi:hypothetical protein
VVCSEANQLLNRFPVSDRDSLKYRVDNSLIWSKGCSVYPEKL